jgi:hypothetical protein
LTIARTGIAAGRGRIAADVLLRALAEEQPAQPDHAREVAAAPERELLRRHTLVGEAMMRRCAGTQFDPRVVHAFCLARGSAPIAV